MGGADVDTQTKMKSKQTKPSPHPQDNGWEKRFDKRFVLGGSFGDDHRSSLLVYPSRSSVEVCSNLDPIKAFISSEISKAKQAERERIWEWVQREYDWMASGKVEERPFKPAVLYSKLKQLLFPSPDRAQDK